MRKFSANETVQHRDTDYRVCRYGSKADSHKHLMYRLHRGASVIHVRGDKLTKAS